MLLDDSVSDSQAEPGPFSNGFCSEEWIEDSLDVLVRDPRAGIGDVDDDHGFVHGRLNRQCASTRHGVPGIQEQVYEHLL